MLDRHNATQLPIFSTFSTLRPQNVHIHNPMAGAGRPPSLLAVATVSSKSLRLLLDIIRKRALQVNRSAFALPSACRFNQEKIRFSRLCQLNQQRNIFQAIPKIPISLQHTNIVLVNPIFIFSNCHLFRASSDDIVYGC